MKKNKKEETTKYNVTTKLRINQSTLFSSKFVKLQKKKLQLPKREKEKNFKSSKVNRPLDGSKQHAVINLQNLIL